jgi:hypothetical protein
MLDQILQLSSDAIDALSSPLIDPGRASRKFEAGGFEQVERASDRSVRRATTVFFASRNADLSLR